MKDEKEKEKRREGMRVASKGEKKWPNGVASMEEMEMEKRGFHRFK